MQTCGGSTNDRHSAPSLSLSVSVFFSSSLTLRILLPPPFSVTLSFCLPFALNENTQVNADLCNKYFTMQITTTDADWSQLRDTDLRDLTKCSREFCQVVCGRRFSLDESSLESLPFIRTVMQIWADYRILCVNITCQKCLLLKIWKCVKMHLGQFWN